MNSAGNVCLAFTHRLLVGVAQLEEDFVEETVSAQVHAEGGLGTLLSKIEAAASRD